jgi:NAD(P)-dependent dehydrogenase (short-subunit alcohol dehydrogenase family)
MSAESVDLAGRAFVVVGGGSGIGAALARRLSERRAQVIVAGRRSEPLEAVAAETGAEPLVLDASRFDDVSAAFADAAQRLGGIDGIANCAGSLLLKPARATSEEEWREVISHNLDTAFAVVRAGTRVLGEGGSIALVSSAAARLGIANHEAIAAAKAGIIGLTLSAAATSAAQGIRVNCVAPGLTETPLTERLTSNPASAKASTALHALGRLGRPDDVAAALEWLLDPAQGWITGQVIGVDGGLASVRSRA